MVNKMELDLFIARMEATYRPAESYAHKARELLSKMLAPSFPDEQVPRMLEHAEKMYSLHATTRVNMDAARRGIVSISDDVQHLAEGVRAMSDAYTSAMEGLVQSGEDLRDAAEGLEGSAKELLDAKEDLGDKAAKLEKAAEDYLDAVQQKEAAAQQDDLFVPPKKTYKN